jgi:serine/threonine protein kinase
MERKKLAPGEVLRERYRIKSVLGEGAYGVVYLAEDLTEQGSRWAIKEIEEGALSDEERREARELFTRETDMLRSLHHDGVPMVIDSFAIVHHHYLVMEYIEGETLEERICHGPSRQEVLTWGIKICDILDYLHHLEPAPIIFRDLKPSNIMVTSRGRVVLIDFGIARVFNPQKNMDTFVIGTPGFSPPEQYGAGQSDERSDIYSLCATLYYLLCGENLVMFGFAIPPLSKFDPDSPEGLDVLLAKGLDHDPQKRYGDVATLRKELQKVLSGDRNVPLPPLVPPESCVEKSVTSGREGTLPSMFWLWLSLFFWFTLFCFTAGTAVSFVLSYLLFCNFFLIPLYAVAGFFHPPTRKACDFNLIMSIILAVVLWLLFPGFARLRADSQLAECHGGLNSLGAALEMYSTDHKRLYPPSLGELTPDYQKALPSCPLHMQEVDEKILLSGPWGKKGEYFGYCYERNSWSDNYTLWCNAGYHQKFYGSPGFPQYNADLGLISSEKSLPGREDKGSPYSRENLDFCMSTLSSLSKALESYAREHEGSYPVSLIQLAPRYYEGVPRCPASSYKRDNYIYQVEDGGKKCHIWCGHGIHRAASGRKVTPRFDSNRGLSE